MAMINLMKILWRKINCARNNRNRCAPLPLLLCSIIFHYQSMENLGIGAFDWRWFVSASFVEKEKAEKVERGKNEWKIFLIKNLVNKEKNLTERNSLAKRGELETQIFFNKWEQPAILYVITQIFVVIHNWAFLVRRSPHSRWALIIETGDCAQITFCKWISGETWTCIEKLSQTA